MQVPLFKMHCCIFAITAVTMNMLMLKVQYTISAKPCWKLKSKPKDIFLKGKYTLDSDVCFGVDLRYQPVFLRNRLLHL